MIGRRSASHQRNEPSNREHQNCIATSTRFAIGALYRCFPVQDIQEFVVPGAVPILQS
jgi:hypothetical protein